MWHFVLSPQCIQLHHADRLCVMNVMPVLVGATRGAAQPTKPHTTLLKVVILGDVSAHPVHAHTIGHTIGHVC